MMKKHVYIVGTGTIAEMLWHQLDFSKVEIINFVNTTANQSSEETCHQTFHDIRVIGLSEIQEFRVSDVIVATGYVSKVMPQLLSAGIPAEKIVAFIINDEEQFGKVCNGIKDFFDAQMNRSRLEGLLKEEIRFPKIYPAAMWMSGSAPDKIRMDYCRETLLKLLFDEINNREIPGEIAELGVYKGDFTVCIEDYIRDRKLYLFDTFEGNTAEDIEKEAVTNKENELCRFNDTSEELVRHRLSDWNNKNIIFKKGHFPDSFDLKDEIFCFVSMDINIYSVILSGLRLFYPRMSDGGYILIRSYNSPFFKGTKCAVDDFAKEENIRIVPCTDMYGSVIIVKL